MTQKNFVVHNGLTVGNIVLDVASNSITGAQTANVANLAVTQNANLGTVANVNIGGGLDGQLLRTDGNGGLSWLSFSPDSGLTCQVDVFTGTGTTDQYTLSLTPVDANYITVVIDGVTQLHDTYSLSGRVLTIGDVLPSLARMEVTTLIGYGNSALQATVDNYTGNGAANTYTLSVSPPTIGSTTAIIDGAIQMKNSYTIDGANIVLSSNLPNGSVLEVTTLQGSNITPNYANYANYANFAGTANTANSVSVSNVAGVGNIATINLNGNGSQALVGNGAWVAFPDTSNANYANFANVAATANSVSAANVTGTVANANYSLYANVAATANSVSGSNVSGEVATANYSSYSNIANTANSVALANVSGIVVNLNELWVSAWGNDTTGNGTQLNPYLTIGKAVSMAANGYTIMVRPGGYYEDVTVANLSAVTISSDVSGGGGPFTPAIYGNLTVSGNSGSIAVKGIGVRDTVTHSASGSLYITNMQIGTAGVVGTINKTGNGYLSVQDCNWSLTSGANLTLTNITGSNTTLFSNVAFANLVINNANASVSVTNGSTTLTTTLTTGTLNVFESFMYTLGNSGFFAITSTSGTVNLRNSTLVNPNLTAARVNLSAGTIFAYGDVFFDRANSNLGIQAGTTVDFQALRVANAVSSSTLSVSGNANVGNIGATNFVGSGASLTAITGANVTGTVANATFATSAGTANTANSVTPANITQTAWTAYTPTWTASVTNPAIGNGTITGRYQRIGNTVSFSVDILMGSTTTFGSGDWRVSLPLNAQSTTALVCPVILLDNGTRWYNASAFTAYSGANSYVTLFEGAATVTATTPFTWTNGDRVVINGTYETA